MHTHTRAKASQNKINPFGAVHKRGKYHKRNNLEQQARDQKLDFQLMLNQVA